MSWSAGEDITAAKLNATSCILLKDDTQSIPNASDTVVTGWTDYDRNDGGMWDGSSAYIEITRTGLYWVGANIIFSNNATGDERDVYIIKNNTSPAALNTLAPGSQSPSVQTGLGTFASASGPAVLAAGDLLRVVVYQNSGAALNIRGDISGGPLRFWALWQGE